MFPRRDREGRVQVLEGGEAGSELLKLIGPRSGYHAPGFPTDERSLAWRTMIAAFHAADFHGEGKTIVIVDTGVLTEHPSLSDCIAAAVDLTGQGVEDQNGHGTLVALLAHLVAPKARIVSIKVLGRDGRGVGRNEVERTRRLCEGIGAAAAYEPTIVNVSAGLRRTRASFGHLIRFVCTCEVCGAAAELAARTSCSIFAAAGNQPQEADEEWWCPARGGSVSAVVALDGDQPIADFEYAAESGFRTTGVQSSITFRPHHPPASALVGLWRRLFPWRGRGSSFAAPLVAGTATLLAEAFWQSTPRELFWSNTPDSTTRSPFMVNLQHLHAGYAGTTRYLQGEGAIGFEYNLNAVASLSLEGGDFPRAIRTYGLISLIEQSSVGLDALQRACTLYNLGLCHGLAGDDRAAIDFLIRSIYVGIQNGLEASIPTTPLPGVPEPLFQPRPPIAVKVNDGGEVLARLVDRDDVAALSQEARALINFILRRTPQASSWVMEAARALWGPLLASG